MRRFIERLAEWSEEDSAVRATLRRSLAFDPGEFPPSYRYVEPFVGDSGQWRRRMMYLSAGVWANHWRHGRSGPAIPLARAAAVHQLSSRGSASVERRFISLLDSDESQLPYRLRQMVALLKDYSIDFESLLLSLLQWNHPRKWVQQQWAREFYQNLADEPSAPKPSVEEAAQ